MIRLTRLKKRAEFLRMAQKGKKVVTPGLIGQVAASADSCEMRVGFTVTKKVGNAVTRNRARRRLKEASRLVISESQALSGEMVFIGRHQTINRPFESLKQDVRKALKTLHESGKGHE